MKIRSAYKAVNSHFYWNLYINEKGEEVVIPASGRHWYLFQKACIKLKQPEVIQQYSDDVNKVLGD